MWTTSNCSANPIHEWLDDFAWSGPFDCVDLLHIKMGIGEVSVLAGVNDFEIQPSRKAGLEIDAVSMSAEIRNDKRRLLNVCNDLVHDEVVVLVKVGPDCFVSYSLNSLQNLAIQLGHFWFTVVVLATIGVLFNAVPHGNEYWILRTVGPP